MTLEEMKSKLKISVADYRYEHALLVSETAKQLAHRYGIDEKKAYIAGLLHDCAKGFTDDPEMPLALAAEAGIIPTPTQLNDPMPLLHAQLSAYIAKRDYNIYDDEILNAISQHVPSGTSLTELDKIIYIADLTEPTRKDMDKYREIPDLDEAFFQLYNYMAIKIIQNGWFMEEHTAAVYNSLLLYRKINKD